MHPKREGLDLLEYQAASFRIAVRRIFLLRRNIDRRKESSENSRVANDCGRDRILKLDPQPQNRDCNRLPNAKSLGRLVCTSRADILHLLAEVLLDV